jgi:hypothetical protein
MKTLGERTRDDGVERRKKKGKMFVIPVCDIVMV